MLQVATTQGPIIPFFKGRQVQGRNSYSAAHYYCDTYTNVAGVQWLVIPFNTDTDSPPHKKNRSAAIVDFKN
jgi:hypothetical protein